MTAGTGAPPAVTRASGMRAMCGTLRRGPGAAQRRLICRASPGPSGGVAPDADDVVEITIQYCDESETLGAGAAGHPRTTRDALNVSPESGEKREGLRPGSRPPPP